MQRLLAANADVEVKNNDGATALLEAVDVGNRAAAELLLDHGADLAATRADGLGALLVR